MSKTTNQHGIVAPPLFFSNLFTHHLPHHQIKHVPLSSTHLTGLITQQSSSPLSCLQNHHTHYRRGGIEFQAAAAAAFSRPRWRGRLVVDRPEHSPRSQVLEGAQQLGNWRPVQVLRSSFPALGARLRYPVGGRFVEHLYRILSSGAITDSPFVEFL